MMISKGAVRTYGRGKHLRLYYFVESASHAASAKCQAHRGLLNNSFAPPVIVRGRMRAARQLGAEAHWTQTALNRIPRSIYACTLIASNYYVVDCKNIGLTD